MTGVAVTLVTWNCDLYHQAKLVRIQALRADTAAVAIVATHLGDIAEVDGMLKVDPLDRRSGYSSLLLLGHGVTGVAILADHLAILAHVLPVVAAETPARIEMAQVIGMGLPV